ncbi:MAG: D-alanine--D-alanine ligase [Dehalococcoidales bacterium]|nr:D-alanine--D-alanine ligase [Dehalococcoidales bacterium]
MSSKQRVAVIFGGKSGEHEVSLMSAASIIEAIPKSKYEVVPVGITKGGRWLGGDEALRMLQGGGAEERSDKVVMLADAEHGLVEADLGQGHLRDEHVDVVFPVLHGPYGEDGTVQGLLEIANLPYVGAGVTASAVGMDKVFMKAVFLQAGLPIVNSAFYLRSRLRREPDAVHREIASRFGYPCFVKPANLGSSVGISKAHDDIELEEALELAAKFDRKIVVEQAVDAREIECSVLGNDDPIASLPGEIVPSREFYDYDAKYADENSRLIIPAHLDDGTIAEVRDLAVRAFKAVDCAGMARVDFFLDRRDGRVWLNEVNTIPGFTRISMYPKLWEATGISYPDLVDRLIQLAFERHRDKLESATSYANG